MLLLLLWQSIPLDDEGSTTDWIINWLLLTISGCRIFAIPEWLECWPRLLDPTNSICSSCWVTRYTSTWSYSILLLIILDAATWCDCTWIYSMLLLNHTQCYYLYLVILNLNIDVATLMFPHDHDFPTSCVLLILLVRVCLSYSPYI